MPRARLGAEPEDCLVIEDSAAGVEAARARRHDRVRLHRRRRIVEGGEYGERLRAAGAALIIRRHARAARDLDRDARRREPPAMARTTREARRARLDDAARAGWLYYVAGNTQDEIARKLGVSRQTAQRLVSLAMSERLIKVRLDHPIARCMELASALEQRYDLRYCEVSPTDPGSTSATLGIAQIAAAEMERWLRRARSRRHRHRHRAHDARRRRPTAGDAVPAASSWSRCVGTGKVDGSASFYDVIIRVSDTVRAPHYPMPLPVIARSVEERDLLTSLPSVRSVLALVEQADVDLRRRRLDRREFAAAEGRFHQRGRERGACAAPARSARSPAGRSTREAG